MHDKDRIVSLEILKLLRGATIRGEGGQGVLNERLFP